MSATNQSPLAFPVRQRATAPQVGNQIRPENRIPTTDDPQQASVKKAIRDTVDLLYKIRDDWTPTSLYVAGDPTGAAIVVPTTTGAGDTGTAIALQVQFTRPGTWLVSASVSLKSIGDNGSVFTVSLTVNNSPQSLAGVFSPAADAITPIVQYWQVTSITGDENCTLKIVKDAGGGTSAVLPPNSTMLAVWQGGATS